MSRMDRVRAALVRGGLSVVKAMVLHLPDRVIARILGVLVRTAYAVTGDPNVLAAGGEVVDIFASGPPFTTTVRKLMRAAEPELIVSTIRCLRRRQPYGAM